ncbi:non-heme iron oxygenase ferredoxin subunit [Citricoccus sp. SGAir0253]|uniref:non-heme iron oxygenase ferredoxin subunit n=1 Tax=Citricoccus sp. SGAir0253 TaxID=2567881 RepID=UPI0010CD4B2A|nr:non-heme iron oxygenase ferredoxin subunit [Citricoccus sp. SGAir0253]QCU78107.1 non-heme iron oxygenase ferredoxin subunit [Citricoccus sp. SGAir0253]
MAAGVRVCGPEEIGPEEARRFIVDGTPVAVARASDGSLHALDDTCSHEEVSLSDGFVEGCALECIGHGSAFDLVTGRPNVLPATEPVNVYALAVEDDGVWVDTSTVLNRDA